MRHDDRHRQQQQLWMQLMMEVFLIGCALVGAALGVTYLATGGL